MSEKELVTLSQEVTNEYSNDPFCFDVYERFIKYAGENSLLDSPLVWKTKSGREPLTTEDLQKWETAIQKAYSGPSLNAEKSIMYHEVAEIYPTSQFYLKYLDYMEAGALNLVKLQHAYQKCKHDFAYGQSIFDRYLAFLLSKQDWLAARALYEARLKIPHRQIQQTYESFSSFVSNHFPQDYIWIMRDASKVLRATERSLRYYELLELDIASDPDSPEPWANYIKQVSVYSDNTLDHPAYLSVFCRSLFCGSRCKVSDPSWLDLWRQTFRLVNKSNLAPNKKRRFAISLVRAYRADPRAYSEVAWTLRSESDAHSLCKTAINSGVFKDPNPDSVVLAKDLVTVEYALHEDSALADTFITHLHSTCNAFPNAHNLISLCLKILEEAVFRKDSREDTHAYLAKEKSELIASSYLKQNKYCAEAWITAIEFFDRVNSTSALSAMLENLENHLCNFDDPRSVFIKADTYLRLRVKTMSLSYVQEKLQKLAEAFSEYEQTQQTDLEKAQSPSLSLSISSSKENSRPREDEHADCSQLPQPKKVKSQPIPDDTEPSRSREQFRVKLYPLAKGANEEVIKKFLSGYADPLSITIADQSEDNEKNFAVIELSSEQEVLSCLTRQFKPLLSIPVNIHRIFGTTVWVTNYPSSYDSQDIHNMISQLTGKHPIALRLPYQRDNKERRFFYADFPDEQTASMVRDKLSGKILDGHELQAEISNPTLRKPRDIAPPERQIHLHNLNFKQTTEDSLRTYFSQWGEIASIHLPLSDASKSKGFLNNGFAFVTFATEASAVAALAQGKATIDEREIDISAVKPKKHSEKRSAGYEEQVTITINNISETVTEAQLQKYIEDKVGPVSKLSLKPSKKMALVEFEDVKTAGKAGFALEGVEYEDHILHVGSKKDFFQEEKILKVPGMVPPMLMRRKKRKN